MSQCEQFVARARRTTRRGSSGFSVAGRRKSTRKIVRVSRSGQRCPRSTASSTRPALLATRSCGAFPSPGQPLGIVNIGRSEDQRVDHCPLPRRWRQSRQIVFNTRNHWAQDQRGAERFDRARREKKSSVERTNHIHGGQSGQLSKRLFCFEDAQVDGEHRGLRLPVARRITTGSPKCAGGVSPRTAPTLRVKTNRRETRDPQDAPHRSHTSG